MATETKQLEIEEHEEDLLKLWKQAVNKFQAISSAKFKQSISTGQYERLQDVIQQPARWSRIFIKNREPEGNLEKLCDRVGEHLDGIEMGIKALGFGFKVAAAVWGCFVSFLLTERHSCSQTSRWPQFLLRLS